MGYKIFKECCFQRNLHFSVFLVKVPSDRSRTLGKDLGDPSESWSRIKLTPVRNVRQVFISRREDAEGLGMRIRRRPRSKLFPGAYYRKVNSVNGR